MSCSIVPTNVPNTQELVRKGEEENIRGQDTSLSVCVSDCGKHMFPGDCDVYESYIRDGMRQALKDYLSDQRKGNTNDVTITRHGDLSLQGVKEGTASNSPTVHASRPDAPYKKRDKRKNKKPQGYLLMNLCWKKN